MLEFWVPFATIFLTPYATDEYQYDALSRKCMSSDFFLAHIVHTIQISCYGRVEYLKQHFDSINGQLFISRQNIYAFWEWNNHNITNLTKTLFIAIFSTVAVLFGIYVCWIPQISAECQSKIIDVTKLYLFVFYIGFFVLLHFICDWIDSFSFFLFLWVQPVFSSYNELISFNSGCFCHFYHWHCKWYYK